MIADKPSLADLGAQRYYHRQAVNERAELCAELADVRRERDAWINAYMQLCHEVGHGVAETP